jgi:hypothetical protein
MENCPSGEKELLISRTESPVTHVAEVAVKRASRADRECPSLAVQGRDRTDVPTAITEAKPMRITR